ncbi:MAG: MBL fold metallo-hydrolase, partial [Bdellovibrionales bacterium]|nr:MBL fold metallo-hydrolase [Bdellovibrionales bacterium]
MINKIHELQCGSFCPYHSKFYLPTEKLTCRCLLLETNFGLILLDTGLPDFHEISTLAQKKLQIMQAKYDQTDLCTEQIKRLGYKISDVQHIILTHLDIDHAGAIVHFPEATIHLHKSEAQYFDHIPLRYSFRYFQELLPQKAR